MNEFMVANGLIIGKISARGAGEFIYGLTNVLLAIDKVFVEGHVELDDFRHAY